MFIAIILSIFLMIGCVSADFFDFLGYFDTLNDNSEDILVVGFNSQFPPFGYQDDNGNFTGFDIELAQEVCKRNNWTFKAQPIINWNTKELELDSNEIDCIWSEFTINGREDDYSWTEPYYNNTVVLVTLDPNVKTIDDLKGKTVEIEEGTSVLNVIKNNKTLNSTFKEICEVDGYDSAFMDLTSGVCDVIIVDKGLANYFKAERYHNATILNESIHDEQYGVAFKKGNDELRDQVQKTLDEMYEDGTVEKIAQHYSNYGISDSVIYPN